MEPIPVFLLFITNIVDRDSSVGIAIRYGLDGLGIESRWGSSYVAPSILALWPTQPSVQWVPRNSRG
jgi:hypothetical protein